MTDLSKIEGPRIPTNENLDTDMLVSHYSDWLMTLRTMSANGQITEEQENQKVARSMAALYRNKERMEKKALTDSLTGLHNRRAFDEELNNTKGQDFGVLLLDIDHFKKVNDEYGHQVGDSILSQIALTLATSLRQNREREEDNDFIARYGGEEIVVILKDLEDPDQLLEISEKLRTSISDTPFQSKLTNGEISTIPVTVSIGAGLITGKDDPHERIEKIDNDGLYLAKRSGRNRTEIIN